MTTGFPALKKRHFPARPVGIGQGLAVYELISQHRHRTFVCAQNPDHRGLDVLSIEQALGGFGVAVSENVAEYRFEWDNGKAIADYAKPERDSQGRVLMAGEITWRDGAVLRTGMSYTARVLVATPVIEGEAEGPAHEGFLAELEDKYGVDLVPGGGENGVSCHECTPTQYCRSCQAYNHTVGADEDFVYAWGPNGLIGYYNAFGENAAFHWHDRTYLSALSW